jgi:hypothetical protein
MRKIYIEQAVFGYEDGHRCLSHSFPKRLWDEPKPIYQTNRSSDLTGYMPFGTRRDTWHSRGFSIDDWYVLMRTWHDVEGEAAGLRSGCCWTHALFLSIHVVRELPNYLWLGGLFRRPVRGDYSSYCEPIHVEWPPSKQERIELPFGQREARVGEFASVAHRIEGRPIIWSKDETAEHLCAYLWGSTDPDKRKDFAFHSGAVNMCYVGKREYDLVCMAAPANLMVGNFYHERVKKWISG